MNISATHIDLIHNILLGVYFVSFVFSQTNQIRYVAKVMADTMVPQTPPPKKLFKPSSITKTPTRSRPSPQSSQPTNSGPKTASNTPRSVASQSPDLSKSQSPFVDSVTKSSNLAPFRKPLSTTSDELGTAGSDTTTGMGDNFTPADTISRSTDQRSPLSRNASQSEKDSSPSFKDKVSRARDSAKDSAGGLVKGIAGGLADGAEGAASGLSDTASNAADQLKSPADIAKYFTDQGLPEMGHFVNSLASTESQEPSDAAQYFKDKGVPEMSNFVTSLTSDESQGPSDAAKFFKDKGVPEMSNFVSSLTSDESQGPSDIANYFKDKGVPEMSSFVTSLTSNESQDSGDNTPRPAKSSADDAQGPSDRANQDPEDQKKEGSDRNGPQEQSHDGQKSNKPAPADVSKAADGTFRDTEKSEPATHPNNKMGEPDVSNISKSARPTLPSKGSDASKKSQGTPRAVENDDGSHTVDNMGRPARLQKSIDIPLQRQKSAPKADAVPTSQKQDKPTNSLGEVGDLRSVDNLRSTDDLPDISEDDSEDPLEEVLDPSSHTAPSASITPIPKIPKISDIDSTAPANLARLAKGLAGYEVDDVGNVVDESGEVLGHVTGDLPSMVGKKVADDGEVYGDEGEILGYVQQNFVNPPSPTEIPSDLLGSLRVDHQGNILDSDGNIIGKFNEPPKPSSSKDEKPQGEQKPKVNAANGGSPSDLFLDVKSTNDGIQLTIRIPTTFSKQPQISVSQGE
ncbi:hypothetical protein F4808DRAFT_424725 [Astrocystis sublimbata]|nr:hypothetical protein F4808DRAFT_424725 [Astrocystis sublimbata]